MLCAHCTASHLQLDEVCPTCGHSPLLNGRYQLHDVLGVGGTGTTYKACHVLTGNMVAVKEALFRRMDSLKTEERFAREAAVLRQMQHPRIPRFVECFSWGEGRSLGMYLVTELVDGETLAEEHARRRYTWPEVLAMVAELLDILVYLHACNPPVIHRDIKPLNVVRRASDGALCLVDFGSVQDAVPGRCTVAGTPGFMAPEQLWGYATPASDIYGTACLALSLLTSKRLDEMLDAHHRLAWEKEVSVPQGVRSLLKRMLEPDPTRRARDAAALARQARQLIEGRTSGSHARTAFLGAVAVVGIGLPLGYLSLEGGPDAWPHTMVLRGNPDASPSTCWSTDTCVGLAEGPMGGPVMEACTKLAAGSGGAGNHVAPMQEIVLHVAGRAVSCTQRLRSDGVCTTGCSLQFHNTAPLSFEASAEDVAQYIRDIHGVEHVHKPGRGNTDLNREWYWRSGLQKLILRAKSQRDAEHGTVYGKLHLYFEMRMGRVDMPNQGSGPPSL